MINASKLIRLSSSVYCLSTANNIGIITVPETKDLYLIDSGNDDDFAAELLNFLNEKFSGFTVKAIINTHSHADHCGGNVYLKEHTGCQIWASKGEASLMKYPEIETGLIWGGTPVHQIRSTYLMAKPCSTDRTFQGEESITLTSSPIELKVISLPGHYLDQTGFLITDTDGKKSFFLGDALSGRNVIRKYWIQYLYDETETKKSIHKIAAIHSDSYIPGHGQIVDNIEGISELNLIAIMETEDLIVDELSTPKTTEELLKSLTDRNTIKLGLSNYVLIGSTLRSYLTGLYEEGRITFEITENRMLWSKVRQLQP